MDKWLPIANTVGLLVVALVTWSGNKATHQLVNSRMTELLELTRKAARAAGAKEEADKATRKVND